MKVIFGQYKVITPSTEILLYTVEAFKNITNFLNGLQNKDRFYTHIYSTLFHYYVHILWGGGAVNC